jgi:hypothetical protein
MGIKWGSINIISVIYIWSMSYNSLTNIYHDISWNIQYHDISWNIQWYWPMNISNILMIYDTSWIYIYIIRFSEVNIIHPDHPDVVVPWDTQPHFSIPPVLRPDSLGVSECSSTSPPPPERGKHMEHVWKQQEQNNKIPTDFNIRCPMIQ